MQGPRGYPEAPSREVAELESDRALDAPLGRRDALRVGEVEGVAVRARVHHRAERHDDLADEVVRGEGVSVPDLEAQRRPRRVRVVVLAIRAHRATLQPHLDPLTLPDGVKRAFADARAHSAVLPLQTR